MQEATPPPTKPGATARRTFVAILAIALVVRLIAATTVDQIDGPDAQRYHLGAIEMLAGVGFRSTEAGPLYSAFLAVVYWLFGIGNVAAVQVAQAILGTASVALMAGIGHRLFDVRSGLTAAGFAALYPPFIKWLPMEGSALYATENLFLFFLLLWIWLFVRRDPRRKRDAVLAGVALGLAALTRPTPLLIPVALAMWGVACRPRAASKWCRDAALLAVGMAAVVLPWTLRNYQVYERIVPIAPTSGMPAFGGNNPYSGGNWLDASGLPELRWMIAIEDPIERDATYRKAVVAHWSHQTPAELQHLLGKKMWIFWTDFGSRWNFAYALMLPLALLGLWRARGDPRAQILHVWVLYTMLSCAVIYGNERMRLPIEPFLIIAAAGETVRRLQRMRQPRTAVMLCAAWIGAHLLLWLVWGTVRGALHVV